MDDQRKASDVLVAMESKLNILLQSMSLYNANIKLILDRVNKVYNYISQLELEAQSEMPIQNESIVKTSVDSVMPVSEMPTVSRRSTRTESFNHPIVPVQIPVQELRPVEKAKNQVSTSGKKIPVSQRITDSNAKDLFMANVKISDMDNNVLQTVKTNAVGKWQAMLAPGTYIVNVIKTDTATKTIIEATQEITIPNSDTVVMLPTAIIKRP